MRVIILAGLLFFIATPVLAADTETPKVKEVSAKEVYELSEKCAKSAAQEFKEIYGQEAELTVDYTNHYNIKLNKCFVLVTDLVPNKYNFRTKFLLDINEHRQTAGFIFSLKGGKNSIIECEVSGTNCQSESEWDAIVKPYMEE